MGVLLVLGLTACSARPFEYRDQTEIPEGEGVFTGEDGAIRVADGDNEGDTSAGAQEVETTSSSADCACPEGAELEAYRAFLRWKAEAVGTPEYEEFQDWRAWRRQRSDDE